MATVGFVLSTGRTSTQNITAIAARAHPGAIIEHEALGPNYFSRRVFRQPRKFTAVLGANISLQRKLIDIEDAIAAGKSYLEVGWPAFAWLPYLADRFAENFRFAHLVRNPFHVATSLTTHGLFVPQVRNGRRFERIAMVHPEDPRVHYTEIAASGDKFSPFERNLFHWLELNQFMIEQHTRNGFTGVFRFEDLYQGSTPRLPSLLNSLIAEAEYDLKSAPLDKVQRKLPLEIAEPSPRLVDATVKLGVRLGYAEEELLDSLDVDRLNEQYSQRRL
ncbi:hypothetical protein [uncultured Roseobacter sp.]|uniref:hypothetical protein n=3 Tax=uncultured Roseobacter sp. TaxID=114847 RepID=UPI0026041701|nr:hypothetical protein [uncultured Roseobacter sp.]